MRWQNETLIITLSFIIVVRLLKLFCYYRQLKYLFARRVAQDSLN